MKALKMKVVLSAFVLLFALAATIGSTFAWFTTSSEVRVDQFQLEVKTEESLLIRVFHGENASDPTLLDATTYSTNLPLTHITGSTGYLATKDPLTLLYAGLQSYKITPVTAVNDPTFDALLPLTLRTYNVDTRGYSSAVANNASTGNFIELKFWLLSQGTEKDVVLQDLNINVTGITQLVAQQNITKAVRLGVAVDSSQFVFARNQSYGFEFTEGMRGWIDGGFNSITPANQTILSELHSLFFESDIVTVVDDVDNQSVNTVAEATSLYTAAMNVPKLVTVIIYIEGWDAFATNAVIAAKFNISFKFALKL